MAWADMYGKHQERKERERHMRSNRERLALAQAEQDDASEPEDHR